MIMPQPKGWHSRGYLPHFDSPETVQFVTFRLADSLPRHVVEGLRLADDGIQRIDRELDTGLGECWLRSPAISSLVQDSLFHSDGQRYRLLAWCLMPNHVHVVIDMLEGKASLGTIVRSWKSFTARRANEQLGRSGAFWHADYFDRYMRNEDQLNRTIEYVEQNPVKAGLVNEPAQWSWSSAYFRSSRFHERAWRPAVQ
jgi:putative transposase